VKVLGGDGSDPDAVARFEREARLMSTLTHPNTVQLFDYGRTPEGHLYLAMEHLDGLNLSQLVSIAGPLPPARVIHLLAQICGSLAEAHAAGLVHRDLKPGNVMVCRRGGLADQVKVLDFGIARPIGESTRELTRTGSLTGTPLYIAPERIQNPQDADPRSDLYSLGAVAYLLLAGRNVFEGNGPAEVLMQSLSAVPPPPSRIRGTPLPAALERLVLDLLAKKPADRPASAAETARRLRGIETLDSWDAAAAEAWWNEHDARVRALVRATAE
jgi:serine/threonine-protein kinase